MASWSRGRDRKGNIFFYVSLSEPEECEIEQAALRQSSPMTKPMKIQPSPEVTLIMQHITGGGS